MIRKTRPDDTHCRDGRNGELPERTDGPFTLQFGEHLFITGDQNRINDQHTARLEITNEVKQVWLDLLAERYRRLTRGGSEYRFVLAPDKQTVYRHLLPAEYKCRQSHFLSTLPYLIDPAPVLAELSALIDTYAKTDSHWNQLGAYLTVQLIHARLGSISSRKSIEWIEQKLPGDLGIKQVPIRKSPKLVARYHSESRLLYDNLVRNNGRVRVFSKPLHLCSSAPSLLVVFGDSFSYDLVHFLKDDFDVLVHIHAYAVDWSVVKALKPMLVVTELTERFLLRAPNPSDGKALASIWSAKAIRRERLEPAASIQPLNLAQYPSMSVHAVNVLRDLFEPLRGYFTSHVDLEVKAIPSDFDRKKAFEAIVYQDED